mmetsp:Transcript_9872/g.29837  ORF Transcript_9872/g.29837 Transcript_9872/m.29837 type:complete len:407 (-) Transcript_9872:1324-2544(-)
MVARRHQHRGVLPGAASRRPHVVQRAVREDVLKLVGEVGISKVGAPCVANCELVEAEHVHNAHLGQHARVQIRPLVCARRNQQATVGAALDGQRRRRAKLAGVEVLCACLEVVKHVLLVLLGAGVSPRAAVLVASAQAGLSKHAAIAAHKGKARRTEDRQQADGEAAVAVEQARRGPVKLGGLEVRHKERHLGAVLACHKHLLGDVIVGIVGHLELSASEDRRLGRRPVGEVHAVRCTWLCEALELEEELGVLAVPAEAADAADAGHRQLADDLATGQLAQLQHTACVAEVASDKMVALHRSRTLKHVLGVLRDDVGPRGWLAWVGHVHLHDLVSRRVEICAEVEDRAVVGKQAVRRVKVVDQLHHRQLLSTVVEVIVLEVDRSARQLLQRLKVDVEDAVGGLAAL